MLLVKKFLHRIIVYVAVLYTWFLLLLDCNKSLNFGEKKEKKKKEIK